MVFSKDNQHRHSLLTCKFKINAEDYFKTRLTKTDMQTLVAHLISHNNQKGLSKLQSKHLELKKYLMISMLDAGGLLVHLSTE